MFKPNFTSKELRLISKLNTPSKVQDFLVNELEYRLDDESEIERSFRVVVREKKADCLEGALCAAAILSQHNYLPLIVCLEARDLDHNIFIYKKDGKFGSVAKSRDENLLGREPKFRTIKDLVMSYYPYYWNYFTSDLTDLTLRGYAKIDLSIFEQDWITNERALNFIVRHLYKIKYRKLFPRDGEGEFYMSPSRDGNLILNFSNS
ncbi:MAG: hypothetical protein AABX55_00535 [Nanoarchaeota archaeon]